MEQLFQSKGVTDIVLIFNPAGTPTGRLETRLHESFPALAPHGLQVRREGAYRLTSVGAERRTRARGRLRDNPR
jgi:hypothetical protein